jgi:hypothetical protein
MEGKLSASYCRPLLEELMKSKFCFRLNGRLVCIDIPVLIERFPKKPGPVEGPRAEPWIEGLEISADTIRDLSVLASMNSVGTELKTPGLQKQFAQFIRSTVPQLNLPKEVEVHFDQP